MLPHVAEASFSAPKLPQSTAGMALGRLPVEGWVSTLALLC